MKEETMKIFTARISEANRSGLVVIMYDIIFASIEEAEEFLKAGDKDGFHREVSRAQKTLRELMATLDMQYEISRQLMSLYIYANRFIIDALRLKSAEPLSEALRVLKPLGKSFEGVAEQDKSLPVMEHTQHLYAGLTYGRGTLNETILSGNSRGYKA